MNYLVAKDSWKLFPDAYESMWLCVFHDFWCQIAIAALCECHRMIDSALVTDYADGLDTSTQVAHWILRDRKKYGA